MSRLQSRANRSISLFPFLAVLVCAMGALIFLLLVITRRMRSDSMVEAPPETPQLSVTAAETDEPAVAPVPHTSPIDKLRRKQKRLAERRRQQQDLFSRRQSERAAMQKAVTQSRRLVRSLQREFAQVRRERHEENQTTAALRERNETIAQQMAVMQRRIQQAKQKQARAESRFAFLPFNGRTGTTRRPIFIECTEQGLRFLPEDIELTEDDLRGFTIGYNPLLAGARALVGYWRRHDRDQTPGSSAEPYILLIVRPGGSLAFYAARKLLKQLGRDFGYELLRKDRSLKLPEVDPQAERVCRQAIQRVLSNRSQVRNMVLSGSLFDRPRRQAQGRQSFEIEELDELTSRDKRSPFGPRGFSSRHSRGGSHPGNRGQRYRGQRDNDGRSRSEAQGLSGESPESRVQSPESRVQSRERKAESGERRVPSPESRVQSPEPRVESGEPRVEGGEPRAESRRPRVRSPESRLESSMSPLPKGESAERSEAGEGASSLNTQRASNAAQPGKVGRRSPFIGQSSSHVGDESERPTLPSLSSQSGDIGYERTITIRIGAQQARLDEGTEIPLESDGDSLRQIFRAIDREIRSWGQPPQGFHWAPRIDLVVSPGGNRHAERLRQALQRQDVATRLDFTLQRVNDGQPGTLFDITPMAEKTTNTPKQDGATAGRQP